MDYLTLVVLFLGIIVLPVHLAISDYKRKEKKIIDIEHKCSEVMSISEEIIKHLNPDQIIKEEKTVIQYQEMDTELSPFISQGLLARSQYILFELNESTQDHKKYLSFEERDSIEYDLAMQ